jgi:hypothetical protein
MTENNHTPQGLTLVAIDIAKDHHDVLIERPAPARRRRLRVANQREDSPRVMIFLASSSSYHKNVGAFAGNMSKAISKLKYSIKHGVKKTSKWYIWDRAASFLSDGGNSETLYKLTSIYDFREPVTDQQRDKGYFTIKNLGVETLSGRPSAPLACFCLQLRT